MTRPPRERPRAVAGERTQLLGWLDLQRSIVHLKCQGLAEDAAHRAVLPTSPLMTVAGIVSHLRWDENAWFEVLFLGAEATGPQFDATDADADWRADGVPLSRLLAEYEQQCEISNRIIAEHPLDAVGVHPEHVPDGMTLRWVVIHMVEETARHLGHLDAVRELLDGEKSYW